MVYVIDTSRLQADSNVTVVSHSNDSNVAVVSHSNDSNDAAAATAAAMC